MGVELYDNATSPGVSTTLVRPISALDDVLPVADIASQELQTPGGQFRIVVINLISGETEIMLVTGNAWTPNWSVERGQEGTDAIDFPQGSLVKHALTAAALKNLISQIQASQYATPSSQQGGNYTFALDDVGTVVESTSPNPITLTIPDNAVVALPIGAVIEVFQYGAGRVGIVGGTGNVFIRAPGNLTHTAAQYATIGLRQRAINEWVLSGDLG